MLFLLECVSEKKSQEINMMVIVKRNPEVTGLVIFIHLGFLLKEYIQFRDL